MVDYVQKFLDCKSVADVRDLAQTLYFQLADNKPSVLDALQKAINERNNKISGLFSNDGGPEITPIAREVVYLNAAYRVLSGQG